MNDGIGKVYLVGAGPGDPELLTVRAARLLSEADCVLHDDLVSAEIVAMARPDADVRNVGKRCGDKTITQNQINAQMIEAARAGRFVVRLKSGDPMLYGRAGEELDALRQAEVPFEIVSGVSAAFAAAAAGGVSLTDRRTASRVIFATHHKAAGEPSALKGLPPGSTLALYMPGKDYAGITADLLENGWTPETACLLVSKASTKLQQVRKTTIGTLTALEGLPSPTVLLVCVPL
ncbi:uroporphyrinogen-III C-methyltransferase [Acidipila rosea]|uniref:uroporphyrinogen-III C-methyltransferase n=1 Tax=Acidipila rosea TaxID=768535 RepID=A0A4R1LG65_9BACT|nr:uroporphyrinogen-III C-methyltransferase [Acidipila rosea]TCK75689.1 uroporphyrinogen-III C-methyltransferase [Acidipila rosea]